jgi:nitroreductase
MGMDSFHDEVKVIAFLVGDLSAYEDERDRHLIYVDGGLVAMTFSLALETKGLASCIVGWPDLPEQEEALRQALPLKESEQCVLCMSIGYPLEGVLVPGSAKKSSEEIVSFK